MIDEEVWRGVKRPLGLELEKENEVVYLLLAIE